MRTKNLLKILEDKMEIADEKELRCLRNIAVLFLETHTISQDDGSCVLVSNKEIEEKLKKMPYYMCLAYESASYARALRDIYYEIEELNNAE